MQSDREEPSLRTLAHGDPVADAKRRKEGERIRCAIERRAAYQVAMDDAATELMLEAEALVEKGQNRTGYPVPKYVMAALEPKVKAWRQAVRDYRNADGGRTDAGGLRDE